MSALDFGARAIALGAADLSPRTFYELQKAKLGSHIDRVESSGYTERGIGAGTYLCDALATEALHAAHPRAVLVGRNGRFFRLLGSPDGFLTPEMLGCPRYISGHDQRPYIQAAIDYAKAVGLKGIVFCQEIYELWAPQRTASFTTDTNHSGNFLVIDGFACSLIGKTGNRTTLDCKGPNGGSLLTDHQVLNSVTYGGDVIWRGNAIKLTGIATSWSPRPTDGMLSHIVLRDLVLRTDMVGIRNNAWPSFPATRDAARVNCWDTSNKGIYCQPDRHIGNLTIENVEITGFLGEAVYAPAFGSNGNCKVVIRNLTVKHSNGQALNPNGMASMDVDGLYAENCSVGIEGWFGSVYGRLSNAHFKDCNQMQLSGGDGMGSPLRPDRSQPVLALANIIVENCGDIYVGSYVHGSITAIATRIAVVPLGPSAIVRNSHLRITAIVHKANISAAIRYAGNASARTISNTQIHLHAYRSQYAIDNGFQFGSLWSQSGSIGSKNYLYARGEGFGQVGSVSSVSDNYVALIDEGLDMTSPGSPSHFDPSVTTSPEMGMSFLRGGSYSMGNGVYPVFLPAVAAYPHNAEITIEHRDASKTGCFMEILQSGTRLGLIGHGDRIKVKSDRFMGRWVTVAAPSPRSAAATIAIPVIAAGDESGQYTITALGCRPYHDVLVKPAALLENLVISAVRAETDVIRFWLRNAYGSPSSAANYTFTARWS